MPLSGAMTTLAIDAFRQLASEFGSSPLVVDLTTRVAVMARQATVVDDAAEVEVRRPIVAGTHCPMTAPIRIPAHRELQQPAVRRAVHERARMISGADHVIGADLDDVGFFATECYLMTPLQECAAALDHRVMAIGGGVIETGVRKAIGSNLRKRSSHARQFVSPGDVAVARCAQCGIRVAARSDVLLFTLR